MNILLTGASGFVGQNLLSALVSEGHKVVACVRDTKKWQARFPEIECLECDFSKDHNPDVWVPRLKGIDLVINAVELLLKRALKVLRIYIQKLQSLYSQRQNKLVLIKSYKFQH
jgi:uncharacterized protein YbjT (DUF2867 family)